MRSAGRIGLVVASAVALFALGGIGLFRAVRTDPELPPPPPPEALLDRSAVPSGSLQQAITALQQRLEAEPTDWRSYASLGLAYVQRARVTADPSYYPKAEGVLRRSLAINDQDNFGALVGMGALALARHDFEEAHVWGQRAVDVNPFNANGYGVLGDAQIELGRYAQAFETYQTMGDTQPGLAAYARAAYARELQGDNPGALEAMEAARNAAGTAEDAAWASYQIGELFFNGGRLTQAEESYRLGSQLAPGFMPPRAGLARVAWARGRLEPAIRQYSSVVRRYPAPEYVITLGDLYATSGRTDEAEQQYELVRAEQQLFAANGVNLDLELALFDADHGDPAAAFTAARAEWERRHSVHVADALAWALYANGRYEDAATYSELALRLGTKNAMFMFHAGMIQLRLGNDREARTLLSQALETNPHFSILYSPVAERVLEKLGAAV